MRAEPIKNKYAFPIRAKSGSEMMVTSLELLATYETERLGVQQKGKLREGLWE
jgi:hypothetical protein